MPSNREMTEDERNIFREGAGTKADTKNRKEINYKFFLLYILKRENIAYENLDDGELTAAGETLFTSESDEKIGKYFIEYFQSMEVDVKEIESDGSITVKKKRPKRKTAEAAKSHTKMAVLEKHKIDLTNPAQFPEWSRKWKGFLRVLKAEGRGDTKHYKELPAPVLEKTTSLFVVAMYCLEQRGKPGYWKVLELIPSGWRHKLHYIIQYGVIFILESFDCRRGEEGIDCLTKNHWTLIEDGEFEFSYYQKDVGEISKNHQEDSENVENSGIIPLLNTQTIKVTETLSLDFNPGLYFQKYLKYLPDENDLLFPQPKQKSKKFDIDKAKTMSLYESQKKIGSKTVSNMMPSICEMIEEPRCTNHMIRVTVIRALKRAGYTYAEISKITGHKNIQTMMENYDPGMDSSEAANMAVAISTAAVLQKGFKFQPVSEHLRRKEKEAELVTYNEPKKMLINDDQFKETVLVDDDSNEMFPELTPEDLSAFTNYEEQVSQNPRIVLAEKNNKAPEKSSTNLIPSPPKKMKTDIPATITSGALEKENRFNQFRYIERSSSPAKSRAIEKENRFNQHQEKSPSKASFELFGDDENSPVKPSHMPKKPKEKQFLSQEVSMSLASPQKQVQSLQEQLDKLDNHYSTHKTKLGHVGKEMTDSQKRKWIETKANLVKKVLADPKASKDDVNLGQSYLSKYEKWKGKDDVSPSSKIKYETIDLTQTDRKKSSSSTKQILSTYKSIDLTKTEETNRPTSLQQQNISSPPQMYQQNISSQQLMTMMFTPQMPPRGMNLQHQNYPSQQSPLYPQLPHVTNPQMAQNLMNLQTAQNLINSQMDPQMGPNMMNPQMAPNMINPQMAPNMMNPQMASNMMNPQMTQNMMNTQMTQNMMNTQMTQSMMNPQVMQSMMNPQVAQTMMNPQMSQNMMNTQMSQNMMNPQMSHNMMNPLMAQNMMNSHNAQNMMVHPQAMNPPRQLSVSPPVLLQPLCSPEQSSEVKNTLSVKRGAESGGKFTETISMTSTKRRTVADWSKSR